MKIKILIYQSVCFVWMFRDQLNLNVVFNEAFHSQEQMKGFLEEVEKSLFAGLEIVESERS